MKVFENNLSMCLSFFTFLLSNSSKTMDRENTEWYKIDDVSKLDSPALVVYPERVKENIRLLKKMIDDPSRLRPHIKTNKSREATDLMLEAGISRFKCATIAEAEFLGICGASDVLLAYQPMGPKLKRFIQVIQHYPGTKYSTLFDNAEAVKQMAEAFAAQKLTVDLYMDLNVGMNRTGINPDEAALKLYFDSMELKGIRPVGLHVYDGHVRNPNINIRTADSDKAFGPVEILRDKIMESGFPEPVIVAGGSPTFPVHARRKTVECSPGTFIYWDKGYI